MWDFFNNFLLLGFVSFLAYGFYKIVLKMIDD